MIVSKKGASYSGDKEKELAEFTKKLDDIYERLLHLFDKLEKKH